MNSFSVLRHFRFPSPNHKEARETDNIKKQKYDTGTTFHDIVIHATNLTGFLTSREGAIIKELLGEGQFDSGLAEAYRARFFSPRRLEASGLLEKGIQRGELKSNLDIGTCIDLMYGPIFYRLLVTGEALDDLYVENLVRNAFKGIARSMG